MVIFTLFNIFLPAFLFLETYYHVCWTKVSPTLDPVLPLLTSVPADKVRAHLH